MGPVLSRPGLEEELEWEQGSDETNECDDIQHQEVVDREEYKCQICNNANPNQSTSLCYSCQKTICEQCESPNSSYIVCESCNDYLYSHNDTLVECQYCGNLWDGHAQCNCYYEECDDM